MNARTGGITAGRVALAALLAIAGALGCRPKTAGRGDNAPLPVVTVLCDVPGMEAEAVESQVTGPVETALFGTPGVERVRSVSRFGNSVVWIEFPRGTDVLEARQSVAERLTAARLPDALKPALAPPWPGEVMLIGLHGEGTAEEQAELAVSIRDLAEFELRPRLERAPGVSQVTVVGGLRRQYQVVASPDRLAAYDITMAELAKALAGADATPPATAGEQGGEHLIRGAAGPRTLEDLADTVVATRNGRPVRLGDLAEVRIGWAAEHPGDEGPSEPGRDPVAEPAAVLLAVGLMPDGDRQQASNTIDEVLRELQGELPIGIKIARKLPRRFDPLVGKMIEELRRELPPEVHLRRRSSEGCGDLVDASRGDRYVVKLFGPDLAVLRSQADEVRRRMAEVSGVTDIEIEPPPDVPKLDLQIDGQKASLLGLTAAEVSEAVDAALGESVVSQVLDGNRTFDVVLKAVESRGDPSPIDRLFVRARSGNLVPLRQLATARVVLRPRAVYRENGERVVLVSCRVKPGEDTDVHSAVEKALTASHSLQIAGYAHSWYSHRGDIVKHFAMSGPVKLAEVDTLPSPQHQPAALDQHRDARSHHRGLEVRCSVALGVSIKWLIPRHHPIELADHVGHNVRVGVFIHRHTGRGVRHEDDRPSSLHAGLVDSVPDLRRDRYKGIA